MRQAVSQWVSHLTPPIRSSGHQAISRSLRPLARCLTLTAGALLVVGALRPWAFVPLGLLRLPLYGALGWGGLAGVAGLILLLHPRPAPGALLGIAAGAAYLAHSI